MKLEILNKSEETVSMIIDGDEITELAAGARTTYIFDHTLTVAEKMPVAIDPVDPKFPKPPTADDLRIE